MVPVEVPESVPVVAVGEAATADTWVVIEPEACAKRPVPPVMVDDAVTWIMFGLEVGQATSMAEAKILSPFAAVKVSCSVAVNPPHSDMPVAVALPTTVVSPRCS